MKQYRTATQTTSQYSNLPVWSTTTTSITQRPEPPWDANMRQARKDAMQNGGNDAITYVSMLGDTHKWAKLCQALAILSEDRFPGMEELYKRLSYVQLPSCDCHHQWYPTEEEVRELIARFRLLYC